ncbi:MAG: NusG domain II-containing protein [Spirochaetia bacterium]
MRRFRLVDIAAILITIGVIAVISLQVYTGQGESQAIYIQSSEGKWVYPLDEEGTYGFQGPLGETIVAVENGGVRVVSSPCPEKICISMGTIHRPGSWIACLPNGLFLRIEGENTEELDAGTY